MTYNELIDALLEIATKAEHLLPTARLSKDKDLRLISAPAYYALCEAIGTLEALPYPPQDPKPGHERVAAYIKEFRAARLERKRLEAQTLEDLHKHIASLKSTLEVTKAQLNRAERSLHRAGFDDRGGEEWVSPVNTAYPFLMSAFEALGYAKNSLSISPMRDWLVKGIGHLQEYKDRRYAAKPDHPGGVRPAAPRPAPPPADNHVHFHPAPKAPCSDCGAPAHKYSECPPFSVPPAGSTEIDLSQSQVFEIDVKEDMPLSPPAPIPADVALQETPKRSLGAEVHNADMTEQFDSGLRQRMFDKLAWVKVGGDTASAKFLIKYVGGSDKLVDVPAEKWQIMIDACDEYMRVRGGHA